MNQLHRTLIVASALALASSVLVVANGASAKQRQPLQSEQALAASFASIQDQLSHIGSVRFRDRLEDAADESVSFESDVTTQVADVAADAGQCRLSYDQKVQRNDDVTDQMYRVDLRDIATIRTEPFEKYENEFAGKRGFVYVLTTPAITTVEMIHPDHKANWFAFVDADAAKRLAETLTEARKLCNSTAAKG